MRDERSERERAAAPGRGITRRGFLAGAGAGGLLASATRGSPVGERALSWMEAAATRGAAPSFTAVIRRRDDMLHLRYDFYNLQPTGNPAQLTAVDPDPLVECIVVVSFPAQHLVEQAIYETDPLVDPPLPAAIAGESRLAFTVDPATLPLPYDLPTLLDWQQWEPRVVPVAYFGIQPIPAIVVPNFDQTAIEYPWWLMLSPPSYEHWDHALTPVAHGDPAAMLTELWHTRLQPGVFLDQARPLQIIPMWARDPDFETNLQNGTEPSGTAYPFLQPLTPRNRYDIVRNSADHFVSGYTPTPVSLEKFHLSALGATMDGQGYWTSTFNNLESWRQVGTFGRDNYVRIVERGYLFPFGHKAVRITISERKFEAPPSDPSRRVAYVRQRQFLVVREPLKLYGDANGAFAQQHDGRNFPFRQVEVTTLVTPVLDQAPSTPFVTGLDPEDAYEPEIDGKAFRFHMIGTDWAGREAEFTSPVVFVLETAARTKSKMKALRKAYNDAAQFPVDSDLRLGKFRGALVHLAESASAGDTATSLDSISWGAEALAGDPTEDELIANDQPRFYPTMAQASARLSAAGQVAGDDLSAVVVELDDEYVSQGLSALPGKVFARVRTPQSLSFGGGNGGGVITPDIQILALSRKIGPVGGGTDADIDALRDTGLFQPAGFFSAPMTDAKILGGISLADIIAAGTDLSHAPQLLLEPLETETVTTFSFSPELQYDDLHVFDPVTDGASMTISGTIRAPLDDPLATTTEITGRIDNFVMRFFGVGDESSGTEFIAIHFNTLEFSAKTGQKTNLVPDIGDVEFLGPLHFVEQLAQYLPTTGNGPSIDATATEIDASVGLAIPTIGLGVFTLENLAFSGGLAIPLTGDPARVRFAFSSRDNPFMLTVMGIGGGGSVAIAAGLDGLEALEISFEFGADFCVDLVVASGSVHLVGGVDFAIEAQDDGTDQASLTAYVRIGGSVSVMAIASVSIECYLGLEYEFPPKNDITGTATFTIEVSVLCFSGSYTATFSETFANPISALALEAAPSGPASPTFGDVRSQQDWTDYCAAFAA